MRRIPCVCVILVLLLSTLISFGANLQPVKAGQFFSDNFDDGVADDWTPQMGSWSVINGEYCVSVGVVENGISTENGSNFKDCVIETKMKFTDEVGFRAGIVFRYTDNEHYYSFELSNEYNSLIIVKYSPQDSGYGTGVAGLVPESIENGTEGAFPIQRNLDYTLKVVVQGNVFRGYVNGQEVVSGNDDSYANGLLGLRARRADACFDDFQIENATVKPLPTPTPTPSPVPTPDLSLPSYSDDFSGDSGLWQYVEGAYRDQTNQYIVLNTAGYDHTGAVFFNAPIQGAFTANFRYKAGGGNWQGDGFTIFFYKQNYTSIDRGGSLGFSARNGYTLNPVPGYGIEFDAWQNIPSDFMQFTGSPSNQLGDPSENHIALIKDYVGNHLTYVNDPRVADNEWHKVCVEVQTRSVKVFVDQSLVLQWNGTLDRTYAGFGFSGASGGGGSNYHLIDDFSIASQNLNKPTLTTSCRTSVSEACFNVRIQGRLTFNGTGIPSTPVFLSYSVTGGESWQDLTLVHTDSDGKYSALWLLSVTGDFLLKAVYKGNENYLGTSNIINFAIEPYTEQGVFSVDSNSTITNLAFNSTSRELCFGVSGDSGTTGYVEVYIPKSLINDISNLKTYLDNEPVDFTTESQSECWLLYFIYQHSSHKVTIDLYSPPFFIVEPAVAIAIIVATVVGGTVLVYAAYKLYHKKPIALSELNEKP
jgi:hypothetical protein